jgi:hypothetical protein
VTTERPDEAPRPDPWRGGVWHGGVQVDRSTVVGSTIKGDIVTPPPPSPPPGEPPLVVTDALRAEVFGLLARLAREGLADEPDVA